MSGIVALLALDGAPVDAELLDRMIAAQRFRGPDGEGRWQLGLVALGHTLHKTTVEAERESQPASFEGRYFLTADARIDARDELCAELRARGIEARTDATDPELILKAYAAWGEDCVQHLLGDFSFALWDAQEHKLFCAVDQLGVKPFFYSTRGGLFAASNSLQVLRLHPHVRDELNETAVGDFLLFGGNEERHTTIYEDIVRLAPGHALVVERGNQRVRRYFALPHPADLPAPNLDEREVLEKFESLLGAAVRDRLRTPRLAIYMSGGLDSTLLALHAKRALAGSPGAGVLEAYTAVLDDVIPDDEAHFAGLMARHLELPIHYERMSQAVPFDWFGTTQFPEPLDGVFVGWAHRLRERVSQRFPVAWTGLDGDTLLVADLRLHWAARARNAGLRRLMRDVAWYVQSQRGLPPLGVRNAYATWRRRRPPPLPPWIREDFVRRAGLDARWHAAHAVLSTRHARETSWRIVSGPLSQVFAAEDASGMQCPLEMRHPLADLRLVQFTLALPSIPWCVDKELLRRCMSSAPPAVRDRPKTPLRADSTAALVQRHGLGRAETRWMTPLVEKLVDARALGAAAGPRPAAGFADLHFLLRCVALGLWDSGRQADGHALG